MRDRHVGRLIAAATFGNALEFFDFTVFASYASYIGDHFFASTDEYVRILQAVSVFGLGFVVRPVGALLIGRYADTHGRKAAMTLTLLTMCLGSLMIAVLPGFARIGIWAPLLLVLARLLQGFSVGGEMGPATAFLRESAADDKAGQKAATWQIASQSFATIASGLLGAFLGLLLTHHALADWGWRIPFAIGALIGPIGLWLRATLEETLVHEDKEEASVGLFSVFSQMPLEILSGFLLTAGGTVLTYFFYYCVLFAGRTMHFQPTQALSVNIAAGVGAGVGAVASGYVAAWFGAAAVVMTCRIVLAVVIVPVFILFSHGVSYSVFFVLIAVLSVFQGASSGASMGIMSQLFPMNVRTVGIGCAYSLAVTVFGGTAQPIFTIIIQHTGSSVSWVYYVVLMSVVSVTPFLWLRNLPGGGASSVQSARHFS